MFLFFWIVAIIKHWFNILKNTNKETNIQKLFGEGPLEKIQQIFKTTIVLRKNKHSETLWGGPLRENSNKYWKKKKKKQYLETLWGGASWRKWKNQKNIEQKKQYLRTLGWTPYPPRPLDFFCFFEVFWFFKSLDTLTAVVHAFVCSCCCYVCTAVCHLLSWSSSAFGQAIAAPCQLLNCLRMIGTPASSPFLCKLSVVGVTLLRCTSVTIMAMERGNADRMEVDTGAAIPEEYLGWKEQVRPLAPILHQHLDLGPTTLTTTMRVSG